MPAVYRVPAAGGTERLACKVLALEAVPSPDGRYLALVRGGTPADRRHYRGAANRELWLYELASGRLERLTATRVGRGRRGVGGRRCARLPQRQRRTRTATSSASTWRPGRSRS